MLDSLWNVYSSVCLVKATVLNMSLDTQKLFGGGTPMPKGQAHWAQALNVSTGPGTSFTLLLAGSYLANVKLQVNVIQRPEQLSREKCLSQNSSPQKTNSKRSTFLLIDCWHCS